MPIDWLKLSAWLGIVFGCLWCWFEIVKIGLTVVTIP